MIGRILLALGVAMVMLAVMPGINGFLREITDTLIEPIATDFELAYWHMVPIVMAIWFCFVVPLYILLHGIKKRGGRDRDDEI